MRKDLTIVLAALTMAACVEDTYDLDKDIDTSVTLGSSGLTTPPIHVEPITLGTILDLDDDSDIHAVTAAEAADYGLAVGDYVFAPASITPQSSNVSTPIISFNTDGSNTSGELQLMRFNLTQEILDKQDLYQDLLTQDISSTFQIDFATNNITGELRKLEEAQITAKLHLHFGIADQGAALLTYADGLSITLPAALGTNIESTAEGFTHYTIDGSTLTLTKPYIVGQDKDIVLKLNSLSVVETEYAEDGMLHIQYGNTRKDYGKLQGKLGFTVNGKVSVSCSEPCDITPVLSYSASTENDLISIESIKGKVDPDVHIDIKSINITSIPDCLKDNATKLSLDASNPMVHLTIHNGTPFSVKIDGVQLDASNSTKVATAITESFTIAPGDNDITISPKAVAGSTHVACADLAKIIALIPEQVAAYVTGASIVQDGESLNIEMGQTYSVTTAYNIVAPLTLDAGSAISYTETLDGFQDELSDIDEIGNITMAIEYDNQLPFAIALPNDKIKPINSRGEEISNVTVTVDGNIACGKGNITITLAQNGGTLSDFDGLQLTLDATVPNGAAATLNEKQTLEFSTIKLTLKGGVTLEL